VPKSVIDAWGVIVDLKVGRGLVERAEVRVDVFELVVLKVGTT